jgi:hypothetical protein
MRDARGCPVDRSSPDCTFNLLTAARCLRGTLGPWCLLQSLSVADCADGQRWRWKLALQSRSSTLLQVAVIVPLLGRAIVPINDYA